MFVKPVVSKQLNNLPTNSTPSGLILFQKGLLQAFTNHWFSGYTCIRQMLWWIDFNINCYVYYLLTNFIWSITKRKNTLFTFNACEQSIYGHFRPGRYFSNISYKTFFSLFFCIGNWSSLKMCEIRFSQTGI